MVGINMPVAVIKSLAPKWAKQKKISVDKARHELEDKWDKAKELTDKKFDKKDSSYWPYVMGIFRRMVGLA
jgi:hypothetical protein